MADRPYDPARLRLHVVTGKGGTGKTTVAAALALALASGGRHVLLCEVEGRQGIAQLFDVPPLPYEERKIAVASDGGEVFALAVEPKAALMEYLELFYRMGRAGKVLERIGAVDFATTIAPGLRDVLLTGKVYEAVRRRTPAGPVYDAVVLDAPPTGRITRFLNVNEEVADLAKMGPVRSQASSIMTLMRSPQTAIHLVSLLEEMPVQETQDAAAELRAVGLPLGYVVVSMVREPVLAGADIESAARGELDRGEVLAGLHAAGLHVRPAGRGGGIVGGSSMQDAWLDRLTDALVLEGTDHALRVQLEQEERGDLAAIGRPLAELPALPGGIDLGALYDLADMLVEQGVA
ncbi:MAG TPA: ArsA-related P-loop ATPase [Kineosporiaceae bacterium]|nr:ArsA-related P-loop ATPase [Kineosporiaceae bacterium]